MVSLFSIPSRQGYITVSSGKDGIHVGVVLVSKDDNAGELTVIGIQGKTEAVFSYQKANSDDSGTLKLDGSAPLLEVHSPVCVSSSRAIAQGANIKK